MITIIGLIGIVQYCRYNFLIHTFTGIGYSDINAFGNLHGFYSYFSIYGILIRIIGQVADDQLADDKRVFSFS